MSARSAEMQQEGSSLRMMGSASSGFRFRRWRLLMVQLIEKSTPGTRDASFLLRSLRRSCDVAVIGRLNQPKHHEARPITACCIDVRLRVWSDRVGGLDDLQGGFREGRGTWTTFLS